MSRRNCLQEANYGREVNYDRGSTVKVPRIFSSNPYLVSRTAINKSLGIALLPQLAVRDAQHETLVEVFKGQPIPERPLYVAFAPGTPPPEKVHSFVDQLVDCASILRSDIL